MDQHNVADCVFFLSPAVYATCRTEHVDADSITVQTLSPLTDSEGKILFPSGSFFSVCAPFAMRCVPALRKQEQVDVIIVHEDERKLSSLNAQKFFVVVVCSRDTNLPLDIDDDDVCASVLTVVRY